MNIKHYVSAYFLTILIIFTNSNCATHKTIAANIPIYVNIKDFGAIGDGVHDDTDAIQKAIDYARKRGFNSQGIDGVYEVNPIYIGASMTVFIPVGKYAISRKINMGSYLNIISEKAIIYPKSQLINNIDCFSGSGWQTRIEGLQFLGFKTAISIDNNNVNSGSIKISNCDFYENDCAIFLEAQSSITIITANRFHKNKKVLYVQAGDKVDVFDNWITSGQLSGQYDAQIINYGTLHFDKNILVPKPPNKTAVEPAWINNYSTLSINAVRQGGESGSYTLVNNFAEASIEYPVWPNSVIIENSDCYGVFGSSPNYRAPAAIRIINLPNLIILKNLTGFTNGKLMDVTQQDGGVKNLNKVKPNLVKIHVENIIYAPHKHSNGMDIPENLLKFSDKKYQN